MKTQELKIEVPKGFEIDQQKSTFEKIVFKVISPPMQKVYEYHDTTEKEFDKLYNNIPSKVKAYAQEIMVVAYYNKTWIPDWNNSKEYKYYPYFHMDKFRCSDVSGNYSDSIVGAPQVFKNKKDCEEAVELFFDIYKESRS